MSRKPEQRVWDSLAEQARGKILFQRHEDKYSSGVPDLSGVFDRRFFFCELKAAAVLLPRRLHLRQRQLNWMREYCTHGVPCLLLARRRPSEWAGAILVPSVYEKLSSGASFTDLATIGRSGDDPVALIDRLLAEYYTWIAAN